MAHSTPIELPAPAPRGVSTGAGELSCIGNATTLITYAGFTLLTDPAFLHKGEYTPLGHGLYTRREIEPACAPQDLPPLDPEIDLGLFHVGGTTILGVLVTMSGEQGVQAVEIIHPRVAIPIHFNDYSVFLSGLDDFKAAATRASTRASLTTSMHYLLQGDTYRFSAERGQVGTDQGEAPPGQKL